MQAIKNFLKPFVLYYYQKYDNSNVFVFIADKKAIELEILDDGFEIGDGVYFLNLGTLGIKNEDELAEYKQYDEKYNFSTPLKDDKESWWKFWKKQLRHIRKNRDTNPECSNLAAFFL